MKPPLQYIHMLPLFYTGSSPSGHFCKQTALLMATLTKPCFSQLPYKLVFLHFHKLTAPVMDIFFLHTEGFCSQELSLHYAIIK